MREIAYLKEQGLVADYEGYLNLPYSVLQDARLLGEGLVMEQKRDEARRR